MNQTTPERTERSLVFATLAAIMALIARSPIRMPAPRSRLPAGYDEVDIAVLDWIAAQARAARRTYRAM